MVASRDGRWPSKALIVAARLGVTACLPLIAGCASNKTQDYTQRPQHLAAAQPAKVEMEDDGEPVQAPPARAMRPEEDDPSQPWSPNYGANQSPNYGKGGAAVSPQQAPNPRLPRQVDARVQSPTQNAAWHDNATSTGTLTRLSETDSAALIAQAISTQEMTRQ